MSEPTYREIAQRELRNDISRILAEVAAGARFRVTVRGRPVADIVPVRTGRRFVSREEIERIITRFPLDSAFEADVDSVIGDTIDEL